MASSASPASSKSDDDRRPEGDRHPRGDPAGTAAQTHAEWAASMQAYYAAAAAAAGGHPYARPPPPQSVPLMAGGASAPASAEGKSKRKNSGGPSGEDSSGSGDGGSEDSSDKRDDTDERGLSPAKWRKLSHADTEGETSQASMSEQNTAKAAPNLNIGMDIWSTPPMAAVPSGHVDVNAAPASRQDKAISQMDERELKRERRKQSNRESARRSRLRKQVVPVINKTFCMLRVVFLWVQECEELSQKVAELTVVNTALRTELDKLKKDCEDMEAENSQLMDEMAQSEGSSVVTTLSIKIDTPKDHRGSSAQLNKQHTNGDGKG
uniref:BZIP domain-containing protein n=1 Tax=Oryza brachyantha TaxID=4533 RepID=J3LU01_ORYBR